MMGVIVVSCAIDITTTQVNLLDDETKLKAVVSVVIMDCFAIHGIKVIDGPNGLFVAMPNRRNKNGTFSDIAHPINQSCRQLFSERILTSYKEALASVDVETLAPVALSLDEVNQRT